MKIKIIFLFLICISQLAAICQQSVTVTGKLTMKPGTTLRFSKYSDYISLDRERLATVKTSQDSSFSVTFPLKTPGIVFISVNELSLEALLYPDIHYTLGLASTQNDHSGNLLITSCNQPINPQTILISSYNIFSDSTLSILFNRNNQRPSKKEVDLFNIAVNAALAQTKNTFCRDMIQSLRINYLTMSRAVNFASAFNRFFDCTKLPIANPAFQSLLSSNFHLYFNSGPPQITRHNLFQGIPDSLHFSDLLQIIAVDPSLKCIPVREMVLLENLYSMIKNGELNTDKAINLLKEASVLAIHPYNRQVANNLINSLTRQQTSTVIPDFSLIFPDGSIHQLSSFKGKPLHITFFTLKGAADRTLLGQLADVQHYADSLGVAHLICVTTDADQEAVKKYWAEKKYPMQLCFAPEDYEMIDFFNAYTYPGFAVLDSKGRINTLAPNFPGEQLVKLLISLYQSENGSKPEIKNQPDSQFRPDSPRPSSPQPPSKK